MKWVFWSATLGVLVLSVVSAYRGDIQGATLFTTQAILFKMYAKDVE